MAPPTKTLARRYLSIAEAAKLLAVTERSIRNWIADGRIGAVRINKGRTVRITEESLAALLRPIPTAGDAR